MMRQVHILRILVTSTCHQRKFCHVFRSNWDDYLFWNILDWKYDWITFTCCSSNEWNLGALPAKPSTDTVACIDRVCWKDRMP